MGNSGLSHNALSDPRTTLCSVVANGDRAQVETIVQANPDAVRGTAEGFANGSAAMFMGPMTPAGAAAVYQQYDILVYLTTQGADLNERSGRNGDYTVLDCAERYVGEEQKALYREWIMGNSGLSHNALSDPRTTLCSVVANGDRAQVETIVQANPDAVRGTAEGFANGSAAMFMGPMTPAGAAAVYQQYDILVYLTTQGADLNERFGRARDYTVLDSVDRYVFFEQRLRYEKFITGYGGIRTPFLFK